MNISELVKRSHLTLIVLGVVLLIIAAIGGLPFGSQPIPITEVAWRYVLAAVGIILLVIGIYFVWREYNQNESEGLEVKVLGSTEELYKYVKKRIGQARKQVDDLTWGPFAKELKSAADKKAFQEYVESISTVCGKKGIVYREVMTFPPIARID